MFCSRSLDLRRARDGKAISVRNAIDIEKALLHRCMKLSQIATMRAEIQNQKDLDDVVINGKILLMKDGRLYRILDGTIAGLNNRIFEVLPAKMYVARTGVPVYKKMIRITKEVADRIVANSIG